MNVSSKYMPLVEFLRALPAWYAQRHGKWWLYERGSHVRTRSDVQ